VESGFVFRCPLSYDERTSLKVNANFAVDPFSPDSSAPN
jgi:hypothetical protein